MNIDNSKALVGNLQNTFSGYKDSATEQYDRTYASKLGKGKNWSSPKSAVGNVLMSAAADTTAGWLNAAGTALKSDRKSGLAVDSGAVPAKTTGNEWYNRAGNYLQREADRAQQIGKIAYHRGSYGLNNAQKLLYDTGIAATQMAGDLALGMGGSATIPMAIRSFGSGAMEARQAGASENKQIFYGAANALAEATTEKMFDGVARIYGKGAADDMVDEFAKRWAKSEGGQALIRGAASMGGEGLEEVVSSLANPALKTIYNGKSLRENYSDLDLNDVVYEGMIGALLGNIGGSVDIAQTGRGNTQNYKAGNSRGFSGQMRNTNPAGTLRNADLNTLYTAAERNAQRSIPYAAHTASVQQQRSTPYVNVPTNIGAAGRSQTVSYADVFRQMQAEQERATDLEYARYKELDRKFLDGSISEEEFEELRRLDNVWREVDVPGKGAGTADASEYTRYKELERKFIDGNIDEQEWNELLRLENVWGQSGASSERAVKESELLEQIRLKDDKKAVEIKRIPSILHNRSMASGLRKPPNHTITEAQIAELLEEADSLKIPRDVLQFNVGGRTGFDDAEKMIHVRGDVFPDENSTIARDRMSSRAVLAHEYYGHYLNDPSEYVSGDWRDEYRASRDAALKAPNLTQEERALLMIDAYDRAKEAGVYLEYDEEAVRVIYGY